MNGVSVVCIKPPGQSEQAESLVFGWETSLQCLVFVRSGGQDAYIHESDLSQRFYLHKAHVSVLVVMEWQPHEYMPLLHPRVNIFLVFCSMLDLVDLFS